MRVGRSTVPNVRTDYRRDQIPPIPGRQVRLHSIVPSFLPTVVLLMGILSAGCAAPGVRFASARCERIERDGELEAIEFRAALDVQGFDRQQLIFQVNLLNADRTPIKSVDGQFQNVRGNVATGKTFLVYPESLRANRVAAVIPAHQLEAMHARFPLWAEFRIYSPDWTSLALESVALPLRQGDALVARPSRVDATRTASAKGRGAGKGKPADEGDTAVDTQGVLARYHGLLDECREFLAGVATGSQQKGSPPVEEPAVQKQEPTVQKRATNEQPPAGAVIAYQVQPGDTLRSISLAFYGDASLWRSLLEANPGIPEFLRQGDVIRIPPTAERTEASGRGRTSGTEESQERGVGAARAQADSRRATARPTPGRSPSAERTEEEPVAVSQGGPRGDPPGKAIGPTFKARLEKQEELVARDPQDLEARLRLRIMYVVLGEDDRALAPIEDLDEDEERLLLTHLKALTVARSRGGKSPASPPEEQLAAFEDQWRLVRVRADLVVRAVVLCSEVRGFASYTAIEPAEFPAGRTGMAHVYVELENFKSETTPMGLYRTELSVRTKLRDASGKILDDSFAGKPSDLCRERRREFFLTIPRFTIPSQLKPGKYSVEIEVQDLLGGGKGSRSVAFSVVP
jgi:hypothetical protein